MIHTKTGTASTRTNNADSGAPITTCSLATSFANAFASSSGVPFLRSLFKVVLYALHFLLLNFSLSDMSTFFFFLCGGGASGVSPGKSWNPRLLLELVVAGLCFPFFSATSCSAFGSGLRYVLDLEGPLGCDLLLKPSDSDLRPGFCWDLVSGLGRELLFFPGFFLGFAFGTHALCSSGVKYLTRPQPAGRAFVSSPGWSSSSTISTGGCFPFASRPESFSGCGSSTFWAGTLT